VQNFMEFTGADLPAAMAAVSRNPAQLTGVDDNWGSIEEGREANLTVLSDRAEVIQTFLAGRPTVN